MTDVDNDKVKQEVRERSSKWIASFNSGDVDACIAAYKNDAVMNAKPFGTFRGIAEIDAFWRPFMASGPGELEYSNVELEVIDPDTVDLSADWKMNVGRGIITKERWVRQPGGWFLEQDDFELQEQF